MKRLITLKRLFVAFVAASTFLFLTLSLKMLIFFNGLTTSVAWSRDNGQLVLRHNPVSAHTYLTVLDTYRGNDDGQWCLTEGQAPPGLPAAERLVKIAYLTSESGTVGLAHFYQDASEEQKMDIVDQISERVSKSDVLRAELQNFCVSAKWEWLTQLLDNLE